MNAYSKLAYGSALEVNEGVIFHARSNGLDAPCSIYERVSFSYEPFKDFSMWTKAHDKVKFIVQKVSSDSEGQVKVKASLRQSENIRTDDGFHNSQRETTEICPHCEQLVKPLSRYSTYWGINKMICPRCGGLIREFNASRIVIKAPELPPPPFYQVRWLPSPQREILIGLGAFCLFFVVLCNL